MVFYWNSTYAVARDTTGTSYLHHQLKEQSSFLSWYSAPLHHTATPHCTPHCYTIPLHQTATPHCTPHCYTTPLHHTVHHIATPHRYTTPLHHIAHLISNNELRISCHIRPLNFANHLSCYRFKGSIELGILNGHGNTIQYYSTAMHCMVMHCMVVHCMVVSCGVVLCIHILTLV